MITGEFTTKHGTATYSHSAFDDDLTVQLRTRVTLKGRISTKTGKTYVGRVFASTPITYVDRVIEIVRTMRLGERNDWNVAVGAENTTMFIDGEDHIAIGYTQAPARLPLGLHATDVARAVRDLADSWKAFTAANPDFARGMWRQLIQRVADRHDYFRQGAEAMAKVHADKVRLAQSAIAAEDTYAVWSEVCRLVRSDTVSHARQLFDELPPLTEDD